MKKIFFFAAALVAALAVNAEDKTWNFTEIFTEAKTFSAGDGNTAEAVVEGELYTYGNKDKGFAADVAQSPKYFVDFLTVEDQDENSKVARLKSQGTGYIKDGEVYGALAFQVGGPSFIQIAAVSSSGSALRKMQILDAGGNVLYENFIDGEVGKKKDGEIIDRPFEYEYEGAAGVIYIVSAPQETEADNYQAGGINYYKIAATNVVAWGSEITAVENVVAEKATAQKIVENGQIYILKNGVKYNILGAEVK